MTDPTAAALTPAALRALATELDDRAEAHRRAAKRCGCGQPRHHNQVAEEFAMIAAKWRTRALKAELATRGDNTGHRSTNDPPDPTADPPSPNHHNTIEGVTR